MGVTSFHQAEDGYPAREAAWWTEEKLMILDGYLGGGPERRGGFAQACKKAGGWYALDLFAGTGLNWSQVRNREINGSALIALEAGQPEANEVLLCEKDKGAFEALKHRTTPYGLRAVLFNGDANAIVADVLARVPRKAPTFALLDPEGSELEWTTVKAVADHKRSHSPTKIEQLILFPTDTGFVRLAPQYPEMVTRMFGHDEWKAIYERRKRGSISPDQARGEYVTLYGRGLDRLGYRTVLDRQVIGQAGQPRYFLVFATDHEGGKGIMDYVFDRVRMQLAQDRELGQGTLFEDKQPRRKRLDGGERER